SWSPGGTGGSAITSWTVTLYIGATAQTPVTGIAAGSTSTTIIGLSTSFTYTFVVQALNLNGSSLLSQYPASDASAPVTLSSGGSTVPATPVAPLASSSGSHSASVAITAPTNGGSALNSYIVTPYIGGVAQPTQTFSGTPPPTNDTVISLTNGVAYTFTVIAHNAIGNSLESPHSASFTPVGPTAVQTTSVIAASRPFWVVP
ncbi:MAG: fibronectin type III domain-containing protein, partial [Actinomycetota bacterium]|nr:fibronectin type III domain-containing protein [Actinomycetota bacterium]